MSCLWYVQLAEAYKHELRTSGRSRKVDNFILHP